MVQSQDAPLRAAIRCSPSSSPPSADLAEVAGLYDLPERVEEVLSPGPASSLAVNPWGTLLAIGQPDGGITIFDLQTRGLAATWPSSSGSAGPSKGSDAAGSRVTALLWSASGRALLSGAADGSVTAWDVLAGTPVQRLGPLGGSGGSIVVRLAWAGQQQQQEANQGLVLVSMAAGPAHLLCLASGQAQPLPMLNLGALCGMHGVGAAGPACWAAQRQQRRQQCGMPGVLEDVWMPVACHMHRACKQPTM